MTPVWDEQGTVELPHGALIGALTAVVGLLLDQSHLSTFEAPQLTLCVQGSNSDQVAQVRQIAAAMDVQPEWVEEHAFRAWRNYGPLHVLVYTHFRPEPDAVATVVLPVVDETAWAPEEAQTW